MSAPDVIAATRRENLLLHLLLANPDLIADVARIGRPVIRFVPTADQVITALLALYRGGGPVSVARLYERWPVRRFITGLERMARVGRLIPDPEIQLSRILADLAAVQPAGRA